MEERYRNESDVRRKERLLCIKLTASGDYTSEQVADICGKSQSFIFVCLKAFREHGFEGLLERQKPGPEEGLFRGVPADAVEELKKGVESGRWTTAEAARRWLEEKCRVSKPYVMDPEAQHVVIADQAGFHLRPANDRVPEGVHLVPLLPYSPELNPCEQLWDVLKDGEGVANGLFRSVGKLRKAMEPTLRRFWEDATAVLSLVGQPCLLSQANDLLKN